MIVQNKDKRRTTLKLEDQWFAILRAFHYSKLLFDKIRTDHIYLILVGHYFVWHIRVLSGVEVQCIIHLL